MSINGNKNSKGLLMKLKISILSVIGMAFMLLISGCSITSNDIGLNNISIDENMQVTATVSLSNINLDNFKGHSGNTLRTIDIYYAYTDEKVTALKNSSYVSQEGHDDESFNYIPENMRDGVYRYEVPSADVEAFKNGSETSYSKEMKFTIPEDAKEAKNIEFLVVLRGTDWGISGGSGQRTGYVSSNIISYDNTKTVLIDVGKGHESLFTQEVLDGIKNEYNLSSVSIEGTVIKLEGVMPSISEDELNSNIWSIVINLIENDSHNGEEFYDVGYKAIDDYATNSECYEDIYNEARRNTKVSNNLKYYLLWLKPLEKIELDTGNPLCGQLASNVKPALPEGIKLKMMSWHDENKESVEIFEGDKEYYAVVYMGVDDTGVLWRNILDFDKTEVSVNGGSNVEKIDGEEFGVYYKVKVDHDYNEPTYTWSSDNSSLTAKAVCKNDESHVLEETVKTTSKVTKEATVNEEGENTITASFTNDIFKTQTKTESIPKLVSSVGLEVIPDHIELEGKEGYEELSIFEEINATSIGEEEITFIMGGFKDSSSYEQFGLIVGGMSATLYPKEGLKEGTYNAIVIIEDFEDRIEAIEIPVSFTVTKDESTSPIPVEDISYHNVEGDGSSWRKGDTTSLDFIFKRNINDEETFSHFTSSKVDDEDLSFKNYTYQSGSLIIKLKPAYLETLSVGEHTLTVSFDDGKDVTTKYNILAKVNPKPITPSRSVPNTAAK